jgi:mannitol-1-phosphate/altronate dehydrogenase
VEEFNRILIQSCEAVEEREVEGLTPKVDLLPFEEAKLYGHNAVHLWLGLHALERGAEDMHELGYEPALINECRSMFVNEIGAALCSKWIGVDRLFTSVGFEEYADDLLARMVNPVLNDRVDRVCRDLERKLEWDDRLIGAMRLALSQGIPPVRLGEGAAIAAVKLWGAGGVRAGLEKLWGRWGQEADAIWSHVAPWLIE